MTSAKPRARPRRARAGRGQARWADVGRAGDGRESNIISSLDVQLVQNLVERCLQLYMNQREVVTALQRQTKIEPSFTSLVWQKLEEQNPEFFKARLEKALHLHFFLPSRNAWASRWRRASFDFDSRSPSLSISNARASTF